MTVLGQKMTAQSSSLKGLEQLCGESNCTIDQVCAELTGVFRVKSEEVAVLKLNGKLLHFLFPPILRGAGSIPLSSSAVAAKTAARRPMLSNDFVEVRHLAIFETASLREADSSVAQAIHPIQKIMSAPIIEEQGSVLGVVQISRKGATPTAAGPDFTGNDLRLLEAACAILAPAMSRFD